MPNQQFKTLVAVNLRLVNPQVTDRLRHKGLTGRALTHRLTNQFYLTTLLFGGIYGLTLIGLDLSKLPGTFTVYAGMFILLGLSQGMSGIYNVFFASKDLSDYLPLPFRERAIFLSKLLVVALNLIPFSLPLWLVFLLTACRAGLLIGVAVPLSVVAYVLIISATLLICALIIFGLTKTALFKTHQSLVMNGLMGLTMVLAVGPILLMNHDSAASTTLDRAVLPPFLPLFSLFTVPLSVESLLTWGGLIGGCLLLGWLTQWWVLPHLTTQLTQVNSALTGQGTVRRSRRKRGLRAILLAYNGQLLREPNLFLQVFSNSVIMPLIFVLTLNFSGATTNLSNLPIKWFGVLLVGGVAFSTIIVTPSTFSALLISLDRTNFDFVMALPLAMTRYLRPKFWLGYGLQLGLNWGLAAIVAVTDHLPGPLILSMAVGIALGTYLLCQHYFYRDYRLRLANWTNVTQLFSRGAGTLGAVVGLLINLLVSGSILLIYGLLVQQLVHTFILNTVVLGLLLMVAGGLWWHYHVKFWRSFT